MEWKIIILLFLKSRYQIMVKLIEKKELIQSKEILQIRYISIWVYLNN